VSGRRRKERRGRHEKAVGRQCYVNIAGSENGEMYMASSMSIRGQVVFYAEVAGSEAQCCKRRRSCQEELELSESEATGARQ